LAYDRRHLAVLAARQLAVRPRRRWRRGQLSGGHALYSHLGQPSLYDVTEGGNGYCDGEAVGPCGEPAINETYGDIDCEGTTACDAATGYDGPSGVGTPKGLGAFKSKATSLITQTTATLSARVNPDGQTVTECKFEYGTSTSLVERALAGVEV
jgi:hypothetical protein